MPEEDLKVILRLCKIYTGARDNVSKKNFEALKLGNNHFGVDTEAVFTQFNTAPQTL